MSDPDTGDDDADTAVCPECETEYVSLGSHWARSQTCDYPVPALDDLAILDGLMVVGGALNNRQRDANGYLSIVHHDKPVLEWIADELDVLVASITEFNQAESIDYHGSGPTTSHWELRTRSLPALAQYARWYDGDNTRTVPEDITVRPLTIQTACLLAARPLADRPRLALSLRRTSPPPLVIHRLFAGYGPRIIRSQDGGYVVRLYNTTDLCREFAPWPRCAGDRFDATHFNEPQSVCPDCGGRFPTRTHQCVRCADGAVIRSEATGAPIEGARSHRWPSSACFDALRAEYGTASAFPSNAAYNRRQRGRDDLPSLSTLYARFGDRAAWLQALRDADNRGR
jgi:ribosomal protein L40E